MDRDTEPSYNQYKNLNINFDDGIDQGEEIR